MAIGQISRFPVKNGDQYLLDDGWLKCDGTAYNQADYSELFQSIGLLSTYGTDATEIPYTTALNGAANPKPIAYGNGFFLCIVGTAVYKSFDGISWTNVGTTPEQVPTSGIPDYGEIVFYNGSFFCGGLGKIMKSTDGASWSNITAGSLTVTGFAVSETQIVALGGSGFYVSTDGTTFTSYTHSFGTGTWIVKFKNEFVFLSGNTIRKTSDFSNFTTLTINEYSDPGSTGPISNNRTNKPAIIGDEIIFPRTASFIKSSDLVTFTTYRIQTNNMANARLLHDSGVPNKIVFLNVNNCFVLSEDLVSFDNVYIAKSEPIVQPSGSGSLFPGYAAKNSEKLIVPTQKSFVIIPLTEYNYNTATQFIVPNMTLNSQEEGFEGDIAPYFQYYIKATADPQTSTAYDVVVDAIDVFDFVGANDDIRETHLDAVTNMIYYCQKDLEVEIGRYIGNYEFSDLTLNNGANCEILENKCYLLGSLRDAYEITSVVEDGGTLTPISAYDDGNDYYYDIAIGALVKPAGSYWSKAPFGIKISGNAKLGGADGAFGIKQILIEIVAAKSGLWRQNFMNEDGRIEVIRTNISKETNHAIQKYRLRGLV